MKNKLKDFIKKHKKGIYITAGVLGGLVLCFFGCKWYLKHPSIYQIIKKSTLDELREKRKKVHEEYLSYPKNDNYREYLLSLLPVFDKEISDREWAGRTPVGPGYPREHGYGLYKPD